MATGKANADAAARTLAGRPVAYQASSGHLEGVSACLSTRPPEKLVPVSGTAPAIATHVVRCPLCAADFDLLSARWCGCVGVHPSKICPGCERCLCRHPGYERPALWRPAPPALRARGFERLFILYL